MSGMPTSFDMDAFIADQRDAALKTVKYNPMTLFGREWRLTTEPNVFVALAGAYGDIEAMTSMIGNCVHPDERADFRKALMSADGINAEVLMKLLNGLVEAAAERPTTSRSGSSTRSAVKKAAPRKSAARSS